MSNIIDRKTVEMRLDNSDFERNAKTSLSTLDKLKSALSFPVATKAFDAIGSALGSLNFSPLTNGILDANNHFNALDVVAVTALQHITEAAIRTGESLIKSLAIDQVTAGWEKYADKTTGVQTIMAATGKSIDEVSDYLDRLNWFTDETSYNFVDMVNNIGKFTSAGVDLDQAVIAMQGISTATSLAGQNAASASRAMYNLSQSLGAGAVKLQDWMSIENANIATKEFKETIIETAKELGRLDEAGNILQNNAASYSGPDAVTFQNFRNTLSAGWFDADVLIGALEKYGGFAEDLRSAIEHFEESSTIDLTASRMIQYVDAYKEGTLDINVAAEELGTTSEDLKSVLDGLTDASNELGTKAFKAAQEAKTLQEAIDATKDAVSTGWLNIFETIFGNYIQAKELWTDLANEMWDVFAGPVSNLNDLLSEALGESFIEDILGSEDEISGREHILNGLWSIFHSLVEVIETVKRAWRDVFPEKSAEDIFNLAKSFDEFLGRLELTEEKMSGVQKILSAVFAGVDLYKDLLFGGIKTLFSTLLDIFGATLEMFGNMITKAADAVVAFRNWVKEGDRLRVIFDHLRGTIVKVSNAVGDLFKKISETKVVQSVIKEVESSVSRFLSLTLDDFLDWQTALSAILSSLPYYDRFEGILSDIVPTIKDIYTTSKSLMSDAFEKIKEYLPIIIDGIGYLVSSAFELAKKYLPGLLKTAKNIFNETASFVKKNFPTAISLVKEVVSTLSDFVARYGPSILRTAETVFSIIVSFASRYAPTFINLAGYLLRTFTSLATAYLPVIVNYAMYAIGTISSLASKYLPTIINMATKIANTVISLAAAYLPKIVSAAITVFDHTNEFVKKYGPDILDTVSEVVQLVLDLIPEIKDLVGTIIPNISDAVDGIISYVKELVRKYKPSVEEFVDRIASTTKKIVNRYGPELVDFEKESVDVLGDIVRFIERIMPYLEVIFTVYLVNAERIVRSIGKAWEDVFGTKLSDSMYNMIRSFSEFSTSLLITDKGMKQLESVFKGIFSIFDFVGTIIDTVASKIGTFIHTLSDTKNLNIGKFFADIGEAIFNFNKDIQDENGIGSFFERLEKVARTALEQIGQFFSKIGGYISTVWSVISSVLMQLITNFFPTVAEFLSKIFDKVKEVFEYILDNYGKLVAIAAAAVLLVAVIRLANALSRLATGLNLIQGVVQKVKGLIGALKAKIGAEIFDTISDGILKFVAALALLSIIDSDSLKTVADTVARLALELAGIYSGLLLVSGFVEKFLGGDDDGPASFVDALSEAFDGIKVTAIAYSIKVLVSAIAKLSTVRFTSESIGPILVAFGMLAAVFEILWALSEQSGKIDAWAAIAIPLTLYEMYKIMDKFSEFDGEQVETALEMLGLALISLFAVVKIMSSVVKYQANMKTTTTLMLGIAGAIGIVALAMKTIGEMDVGEIVSGGVTVAVLTLALGAVTVFIEWISSKWLPQNNQIVAFNASGSTLIGAIAVLAASVLAVAVLGQMNLADLAKGVGAVAVLELVIAGMMKVSQFANGKAFTVAAIAIPITALTLCVSLLAAIASTDSSALWNAVGAMDAVVAVLAIFTASTKLASDSKLAILEIAAVIAEIAVIFALMNGLDWEAGIMQAEAMSMLLLAMSVSIAVLSLVPVKDAKEILLPLETMTLIALEAGVIVGGLAALAGVAGTDLSSSITIATAISMLLLAMSVSLDILGLVPATFASVMGPLEAMVLVVGQIGLILGLLEKFFNMDNAIQIAQAISTLLVALTGSVSIILTATALLGGPAAIPLAVDAALAIGAFLGVLIVVVAALGGISKYVPFIREFLEEAYPLLEALGKALGALIGGFAAGVAISFTAGLQDTADNLVKFSEKMAGFSANVENIGDAAVQGVKNIGSMIISLSGAGVVNGLSSLLGGNVFKVGSKLPDFGDDLAAFSTALSGFSSDVVSAAGPAIEDIAEALKIFNDVKANKLDDFKDTFGNFGEALATFVSKLGVVNADQLKNSTKALKDIAETAQLIPEQYEGIGAWFHANKDASTFGTQLNSFADMVVEFSGKISGLSETDILAIEAFKTIIIDLGAAVDGLPSNRWSLFSDDESVNLRKMGRQLTDFADSVIEVTTAISEALTVEHHYLSGDFEREFVPELFTTPISALVSVIEMISGAANTFNDGAVEDFEKIVKSLPKIGEALEEYQKHISNIDFEDLEQRTSAIGVLFDSIKHMGDEGSNLNKVAESVSSGIGTMLSGVGEMGGRAADNLINTFGEGGSTAGNEFMGNAGSFIASAKDQFGALMNDTFGKTGSTSGLSMGTGLSDAFKSTKPLIVEAAQDIGLEAGTMEVGSIMSGMDLSMPEFSSYLSGFASTSALSLEDALPAFSMEGGLEVNSIMSGMESSLPDFSSYTSGLALTGATSMEDALPQFSLEGGKMIDSTANGMTQAAPALQESSNTGILNTLATLYDTLDAFYQFGSSIPEAIANGIRENAHLVSDAIAELVSLDFSDVELSITNVIDLNNQNGDGTTGAFVLSGIPTGSATEAERTSFGFERMTQDTRQGTPFPTSGYPTTNNNTFNITSDDPDEVANRVSSILDRQVQRKDATWG